VNHAPRTVDEAVTFWLRLRRLMGVSWRTPESRAHHGVPADAPSTRRSRVAAGGTGGQQGASAPPHAPEQTQPAAQQQQQVQPKNEGEKE